MEYQSGAVSPVGSIQEGWKIIKDDYWIFFGMTLVAIIILFVAGIVLGLVNNFITLGVSAALGAPAGNAGEMAQLSAALVPQIISLFIGLFVNIIVGAVSGALFCGIYMALARKVSSGVADFSDLFAGFSKFQACLIVAAVLAVIQLVLSLVTLVGGAAAGFSALGAGMLTKDGQLNPAMFGGLFLVILLFFGVSLVVNLIISALTAFAYPLIADRNLSGAEALRLSVKSGFSNFGGIILLLILLGLMAFGGALLCFVGILFVAPLITASLFAAYQSVFGRTGNSYRNTPPPPPIFNNQPGF
jgi:uncharacterized membrane protein